jgi:hypothetical protein
MLATVFIMKSYITDKEIKEILDSIAYIFNALEHQDLSQHSSRIDRAYMMIDEVRKDILCQCDVPEIDVGKNKCKQCGKMAILKYGC